MKKAKHENDQNLVGRYLLGKMSEAEKSTFQFRLMREQGLQKQVRAMRILQKTILPKNFPKNTPPPKRNYFFLSLLITALLLSVGLFWHLQNLTNPPENQESIFPFEPVTPPIEDNKIPTPEELKKEKNQDNKIEYAQDEGINTKKVRGNKRSPIAQLDPVDFAPNPYLEEFTTGLRSGNVSIKMDNPTAESIFKIKNKKIRLQFKGELSAKTETPLQLIIFTNKSIDFENNRPVLKTDLKINKTSFDKEMILDIKSGLYYFIIEAEEDINPIYVGKFMVK